MSRVAEELTPTGTVRTLVGDVDPAELGRVDYHEHLFQVSPLLPGDELDDEEAAAAEATLLASSGFETMVDATPLGLGRQPLALARVSAASGLRIVASTGAHREEHYTDETWVLDLGVEVLEQAFVRDLTEGMPLTDRGEYAPSHVRAGVLKAGIGYWRISPFEQRVLRGVAAAHRATGAPVMVHLEYATAAHEVLDVLERAGVSPARVALAHVDRNLDAGLHAGLAERGAFLGYDGPARPRSAPDSSILDCLESVAAAGWIHQVLLGGDVARRSRFVAHGGMPGLSYLGDRFVPRLLDRVGLEAVDHILRANPARWLSFKPN